MEKYIHYCWFGDAKLSSLARKCIKSWKKYLPDYEIVEWNEENFDVNITKFSKSAYEAKRWAFVSDVARVYALKKMGGIYFDTDMMITKKPDKEMLNSSFFVGWESDINVAVGVMGAEKDSKVIDSLWKVYENAEFDPNDLYRITIPRLLTNLLKKEYNMQTECFENQKLGDNINIYARDYFYPISSDRNLENMFTDRTCMIHYYSGSWLPRDQQLQVKFKQMFGEKMGTFILGILVKGKHFLIRLEKCIKKVAKVLLYPLVVKRRKKRKNNLIKMQTQEFSENLDKTTGNYIAFYNKNWLGIKNATISLFHKNAIGIEEIAYEEQAEIYAKLILEKQVKMVIFSGFSYTWDKLIKKIKELDNNTKIKIIWHGSICMNIYDYDYDMFMQAFKLLQKKTIDSIAFVKESMYEFFKEKGYNVEFLANNITLVNKEIKQKKAKDNRVKIGIYASGDRWVKNFYNQLAAASLVKDCIIECIPITSKTYELAELFDVEVRGLTTTVKHDELLNRMAQNDINLYVTFSECAPVIPLESLELGVPCLTANNHHYFEGTELEKYLIVHDVDNVLNIYEGIKKCLENKEKIMSEYKIWKENNDKKTKDTLEKFLKIE